MKKELLRHFDLSPEQIEQLLTKYEDAVKNGVPFVVCDTRHLKPDTATSDFLAVNASTSFGRAFAAVEKCDFNEHAAKVALLFRQDPEAVNAAQEDQMTKDATEQEQFEQYNLQLSLAKSARVPLVTFDARHLSFDEYKKQFARFELLTCSFSALAALARKGLCRVKLLRSPEVLHALLKEDEEQFQNL